MIRPGDTLQIPYLVQPGDTPYSIAAKFGISLAHLAFNNGQGMEILNTRPPEDDIQDAIPEGYVPNVYEDPMVCYGQIDPVTGMLY